MAFPKKLRELCTPAFLYFVLSMVGLIAVVFQNLGNKNTYNLGSFSARVPNTTMIFIVKFIYILFWTWILNLICKDGHTGIAWFLILIPFILMFVIMGMVMMNNQIEYYKLYKDLQKIKLYYEFYLFIFYFFQCNG